MAPCAQSEDGLHKQGQPTIVSASWRSVSKAFNCFLPACEALPNGSAPDPQVPMNSVNSWLAFTASRRRRSSSIFDTSPEQGRQQERWCRKLSTGGGGGDGGVWVGGLEASSSERLHPLLRG